MMAIFSSRIDLPSRFLFAFCSICCIPSFLSAEDAPKKSGPAFQYASKGIEVSIPTFDEPRVPQFGPASIGLAAKYLDDGATAWVQERACINCHTTGPYMVERPALVAYLGPPKSQIRENFAGNVPASVDSSTKANGGANTAVWRSLGLAEWDKHVTGKLSDETDRSLRDMFRRQSTGGSFAATGEVEIPHITTDFELTLQAARAVTAAPDWLKNLSDESLKQQVRDMKSFLKSAEPRNDYERILQLQLATLMPELVTRDEIDQALAILTDKQHADGGWSLRDMSATENWRTPMSDKVLTLIRSLPDAANPESDPYMTALAIVLMRESGVPKSDERIARGVAWLKKEQRESGRWWMHSLYRGNYHYITYIATTQAMRALALCDELPLQR